MNDLDLDVVPVKNVTRSENNEPILDYVIKCSDLNAQWSTSDTAFVSYAAGIVGVIFLGMTLWETLAAGRLLTEQNSMLKQEQRPWLEIDIQKAGKLSFVVDEYYTVGLRCEVINHGKTAATNVQFFSQIECTTLERKKTVGRLTRLDGLTACTTRFSPRKGKMGHVSLATS